MVLVPVWCAALQLTGCSTSGETLAPPVDMPEAFTRAGAQAVPERWWTTFDDERLSAVVDTALPRDTVVYGSPAYPVYQVGALFAGAREHAVILERARGYRLDLAALPTELLDRTAIAWCNYPHNPTGACVDAAYWREQAACCAEHGILLASDECYADLWFDEAPPPPSVLQATTSGVLVFGSCSKRSGMTGYRSGFIAGDAALIGVANIHTDAAELVRDALESDEAAV